MVLNFSKSLYIFLYIPCHNFRLKQNLEFIAKGAATSDSDVILPVWVYST